MTGDEITRGRAQAQRERWATLFPVYPSRPAGQIRPVRKSLAPLVLVLLALTAPLRGAGDPLDRYSIVAIKPATMSIYIGTITMSIPPFVRKNAVYASTYSAKVFPYFFYNESGRIWIVIPDQDLKRLDQGFPIDFVGHGVNNSGETRRVEGRATPTGPTGGKIRVKVYVTRRIALTYDSTYELRGAARPPAGVTPR